MAVELSRLSVDKAFDLGLVVLEALHEQRDDWAREQLKLPDGSALSTPGYSVVVIRPGDLEERIRPGRQKSKNWRSDLWREVRGATFATRHHPASPRPLEVSHRLLAASVDGRRLDDNSQLASLLRTELGRQGLTTVDAFFVTIDDTWARTLMGHYIDECGAVHWGAKAVAAAQRAAKGDRQSKVWKQWQTLREQSRKSTYFNYEPNVMVLANASAWEEATKRQAVVMMMEQTPRTRKTRSGVKLATPKPASPKGLEPFNGNGGYGYGLPIWLNKALQGMKRDPKPSETKAFLSSLHMLHQSLGLEIVVDNDTVAATPVALAQLAAVSSRSKPAPRVNLKLFLPKQWRTTLPVALAKMGAPVAQCLGVRPGDPLLDLPSSVIRTRRFEAHLRQEDVARALGVTKACVSQWESGKRSPQQHQVEAILARCAAGRDLEAVNLGPKVTSEELKLTSNSEGDARVNREVTTSEAA